MNDLESLKKFVQNVLKLQGKWLTPGGNTKQFKCSNGNVIINWYSNKQQTLNFQGRDGPALKDKLIELVHKKARKTTETQDANSLSSTEQSFQPFTLLQETDNGQSDFQTSTGGESLLNGSEKRPNSEIIADIEGSVETRFIDPSETSSRKYKASVDGKYSKTRWKCFRCRAPRLQKEV